MGIEHLSSASDFAHLDGALVYPMFIDDHHVLITEDGATLLLPEPLQVQFAGRFGIGTNGVPHVDIRVSETDALRLAAWGERLSSPEMVAHLRGHIEQVLAVQPEPEKYVNKSREEN